jgi:hypothetical protein
VVTVVVATVVPTAVVVVVSMMRSVLGMIAIRRGHTGPTGRQDCGCGEDAQRHRSL